MLYIQEVLEKLGSTNDILVNTGKPESAAQAGVI